MPGQLLFQPNPPPDPSQLPDAILDFRVQLNTQGVLSSEELHAIKQFRNAADYIAAGKCLPPITYSDAHICISYDLPQGQCPC